MFWATAGASQAASGSTAGRALAALATPLTNIWKSRRDLAHWVAFPSSADAIFLGDGVSLDRIDGRWQDRYGEPVMTALDGCGLRTFLMQSSDLRRLPWRRATYPANVITLRAALRRRIGRYNSTRPLALPDHAQVLEFLTQSGVRAPSLNAVQLQLQAHKVSALAGEFERVLRAVKPKMAFTVAYYAGLGPAFLLACRRQGILSVDLQHCPQLGAHKAYSWSALPPNGYATLPAVFWNWSKEEAADIAKWADTLSLPWHRSVYGGHTQLAPFLDEDNAETRAWDRVFRSIGSGGVFEREVLVAMQSIPGHKATWDALAALIESADRRWRWWIRRHPAAHPSQDLEYQRLLSLRGINVVIDEASSLPLPALLRHMTVVVSLASGAAAEAAAFGVPSIFLSNEAKATFFRLLNVGIASVIDVGALHSSIKRLPRMPIRPPLPLQPNLGDTLSHVETLATDYAQLCRSERSLA